MIDLIRIKAAEPDEASQNDMLRLPAIEDFCASAACDKPPGSGQRVGIRHLLSRLGGQTPR